MKKRRRDASSRNPAKGNEPVSVGEAFSLHKPRQLRTEELAAALQAVLQHKEEDEFKFSLQDPWSVQLFVAVARKYGLEPYRTHGQKSQTVMVRARKSVVENQLWPEFNRLGNRLNVAFQKATDELIRESLGPDSQ
ncbi:MAG TPA: hypothetical protein DD435_03815 [Cyanobacteria bacterium UBA8530]|nr:hypothetical protein [Cyanobacteria bacterium UBA8530]